MLLSLYQTLAQLIVCSDVVALRGFSHALRPHSATTRPPTRAHYEPCGHLGIGPGPEAVDAGRHINCMPDVIVHEHAAGAYRLWHGEAANGSASWN